MATILRVDTPSELRDIDARLSKPSVRGRIALSVVMAAAAPIVLLFSLLALDPIGVGVSLVWFVAWTGWIFRMRSRLKAALPYRVTVRAGVPEIRRAHSIYHRLSPESSSREYALPLVRAMYRISTVPVQGDIGERHLVNLMRERVDALQRLLDAEDQVAIASAGQWANDRDDMNAVTAYQDALNEVAAKLEYDV